MNPRECLRCSLITGCGLTSEEKILAKFSCPLFSPVAEAIYQARVGLLSLVGPRKAIEVIIDRPKDGKD